LRFTAAGCEGADSDVAGVVLAERQAFDLQEDMTKPEDVNALVAQTRAAFGGDGGILLP